MIPRLNPQESGAARGWLQQPKAEDISSNGEFTARAEGDSIVVSDRRNGTEKVIPTPGFKLEATAVSDDGRTVAFLGKKEAENNTVLVRVRDDKSEVLVDNVIAMHDVDLSPDGKTVYAPNTFEVVKVDDQGKSILARMPVFVDRVEVLPGGRILAEGHTNAWGGASAPAYYVLDEKGGCEFLSSVQEAESLGPMVKEPLLSQYEAAYPGTPVEQREILLDRFGYQTPTYRLPSPDRSHMVFEFQSRLSPADDKSGVYAMTRGQGDAVLLTEPGDSTGLGSHHLSSVEWSPRSQRMALVFTADHDEPRLAVAESDGSGFKVLPGRLPRDSKDRVMAWSDDERRLGFEVREGDRVHIYCYDATTGMVFPVMPDVRLVGWDDDTMRVRLPSGSETTIPALPMNTDDGFGVIVGNPGTAPKTPPIPIKVTDEYIEVGGVRVPRRQEDETP